tara:strand:- start:18731 stop:20032 length:1302 start_codon:yes stop_codon:yes gene_type:complete
VKHLFSAEHIELNGLNTYGWVLFQLGLFILPSSGLLGSIALLMATIVGAYKRRDAFWRDQWNYPLVIVTVWMIIGCFRAYSGWLAWIGLANWIPFFWFFWGFQPYLKTSQARRRCALWLISGTVPVLVTGFGQLWFGWEGPWQLLNGLIIWFVSPGGQPSGRLAGLFDYANIAAAWLVVVWPFSLAALLQPFSNRSNRFFAFILSVAIVSALVLTDSRNAWGGLVLAVPFVLGPASWAWLLPLLILCLLPIVFAVVPGIDLGLQEFARKVVPDGLWTRLNDMRFVDSRPLGSTRISQWGVAIDLIKERPWLGWGAAAFSLLYPLRTGLSHGHAHNLPLELGVAHGFPVSFFVIGMVFSLLIICLQRGVLSQVKQKNGSIDISVFDRAWWTSIFLLFCLHGTDLPFFDSRINLVGWVLLSGLRCLLVSLQSIEK